MFAEGCLYCAARRIQYIQRSLNLAPDDTRNRCRAALADAMELGLPEQEIRAMAKLAAWQVAPPEAIQQPASSNVQRKHGR
jgi:tRNA(Ile)-lysidine synthase TilS/MesJ